MRKHTNVCAVLDRHWNVTNITNILKFHPQRGYIITSVIKCGMKLSIKSQISMVQPLKFGNRWIISSHTSLDICNYLSMLRLKLNHTSKGPRVLRFPLEEDTTFPISQVRSMAGHGLATQWSSTSAHDDVIKWKHRSPVNSPRKGQWRGALMFSLICIWISGWVNNREAGDLRRNHAYYDVIVMSRGIDFNSDGTSAWDVLKSVAGQKRAQFRCTLHWPNSSEQYCWIVRSIYMIIVFDDNILKSI